MEEQMERETGKNVMQETASTSGPDEQTDWIRDACKATGVDVVLKFKGWHLVSPSYVMGIELGF